MTYEELYHWGIRDQKWGVRRYQNPDGTYTEEGKIRKRAARGGYSEDYELSRRDPNTLTNEELKRASDRKRTEAEYTDNRLKSSGVSKTTKYVTAGIAAAAAALALGLAGKKIYDLRKSRKAKESENAEMEAILKDAEKIAVSRIKVDNATQETLIKSFIAGAASQANNAGKNYGKNPEYWNEVLSVLKSAKHSDMDDNAADILVHHGILGQRWGVRRYQNPDGSLTPLGRKRYGVKTYAELTPAQKREANKFDREQRERDDKRHEEKMELRRAKEARKDMKAEAAEERKDATEAYRQEQAAKHAKRMAIGVAATTALLGVGVALMVRKHNNEAVRQQGQAADIEAENLLSKIRMREADAASKRSIREARAGSKNMRRDARSSVLNSVSDWFKNRPKEGRYTEARSAARSTVSDVIKSSSYSAGKSAVKSIALDKDTRLLLTGPTSSSRPLLSETKRLLLPGPKG